jgi:hypothetical protein
MKFKKPLITDDQYRAELIATFGVERAAMCLLPEVDRLAAWARIDELQGESPALTALGQPKAATSQSQKRDGTHTARFVRMWSGRSMRNWCAPVKS